jgi:BlaI family transcriptional regulator, penicillinase repressor
MQILWTHGRANVRLVQKDLGRDRAYNTAQTILNILSKKRRVRRFLKGRAYEYVSTTSREDECADQLERMIERMFSGSAEQLVATLLKNNLISVDRLLALTLQSPAPMTPPGCWCKHRC